MFDSKEITRYCVLSVNQKGLKEEIELSEKTVTHEPGKEQSL